MNYKIRIIVLFLTLPVFFCERKDTHSTDQVVGDDTLIQELDSRGQRKALFIPAKFRAPLGDNGLEELYNGGTVSEVWTVYSDRENNPTYVSSGSSVVKNTLNFMQKCNVLAAQGDSLLVAYFNDISIRSRSLKEGTEPLGWIHKNNLLIWDRCLVTDKGKINRKAMVINTMRHLMNRDELGRSKPHLVEFRQSPEPRGSINDTSRIYQIYYLYKEVIVDGRVEKVLLGREPIIGGEMDILGWGPGSRMAFWNHRIVLEPNWELSARNERGEGTPAKFFLEKNEASKFSKNKTIGDALILWSEQKIQTERWIGAYPRFPVLEQNAEDPNILRCGVMSDIFGRSGDSIAVSSGIDFQKWGDAYEGGIYREAINRAYQDLNTIHILFVFDATGSMQKYFKPASEAIINSMQNLESSSETEFRFAAAIYRDAAEEDAVTDHSPITNTSARGVARWIQNIEVRDFNDRDKPEAVYYGLKEALSFGFFDSKKRNPNVIILVGDAGNHSQSEKTNTTPSEVQKLLTKYSCDFLVFQTHSAEDHDTYIQFVPQLRDSIIKPVLHAEYERLQSYLPSLKIPHWQSLKTANGQKFFPMEGNREADMFLVELNEQRRGEQLDPQVLVNSIENLIPRIHARAERLKRRLMELEGGKGFDGNDADASKLLNIIEPYLTPELLHKVKMAKYQLYYEAYTAMKPDGLTHNLFKRSLMVDRAELGSLVEALDLLNKTDRGGARLRQDFYKAWKELLQRYLGATDREISKMTISEAREKIFGLPDAGSNLLKIEEILEENKLPADSLNLLLSRIRQSYREIRAIYMGVNEEYEYVFYSNGTAYYWIAEEMLP